VYSEASCKDDHTTDETSVPHPLYKDNHSGNMSLSASAASTWNTIREKTITQRQMLATQSHDCAMF